MYERQRDHLFDFEMKNVEKGSIVSLIVRKSYRFSNYFSKNLFPGLYFALEAISAHVTT